MRHSLTSITRKTRLNSQILIINIEEARAYIRTNSQTTAHSNQVWKEVYLYISIYVNHNSVLTINMLLQ